MSMTHEEMIAVIHAHQHGAKLEWKRQNDFEWSEAPNPTFNFGHYDYRVAEKPAQKVNMWQWVVKRDHLSTPEITCRFFASGEHAAEVSGAKVIQRADWTMIEVDAETAK